jgi:hypothetical protein
MVFIGNQKKGFDTKPYFKKYVYFTHPCGIIEKLANVVGFEGCNPGGDIYSS